MRVLFVGGGTGGHLTPALGLAEALEQAGHETLFLLGGREVEQDYVGTERATESLRFDQSRWPRPIALLGAMGRARRHAARFRPHVTVALGGAASAASLAIPGAPLVLLEGNYVVGKSVRWMQSFAALTLTMYADTAGKIRRAQQVGPLPRRTLDSPHHESDQNEAIRRARQYFGLHVDRPVLLALGGSQGARDVNLAAQSLLPELRQRGWQLLLLCGPGKASAFAEDLAGDCVVLEHCSEMGLAYTAADFVLSRGGASTLGELWLRALPAMILPYPYHKDRQQEWNARALAPGVCCHEHWDEQARSVLLACLEDSARRADMAESLRQAGPLDGRAKAVQLLEEISGVNA